VGAVVVVRPLTDGTLRILANETYSIVWLPLTNNLTIHSRTMVPIHRLQKVLGVDNANSVGTTVTGGLVTKIAGRSFSVGFALKELGNTLWYLGVGFIASEKHFSQVNDQYNQATAACHAKYGY